MLWDLTILATEIPETNITCISNNLLTGEARR
jgi:hypothetical protein